MANCIAVRGNPATLNSAIELGSSSLPRELHHRNVICPISHLLLPPSPRHSLTHDRRSRLFCACTRYITFSPLIHLCVHKEFLALCASPSPPHFPLVIFTGVIFSSLKATPLSRMKARKENRGQRRGESFDTRWCSIQMATKRNFDSVSGSKRICSADVAYQWILMKYPTCLFNLQMHHALRDRQ